MRLPLLVLATCVGLSPMTLSAQAVPQAPLSSRQATASSGQATAGAGQATADSGSFLLTIFLRHDQTKTVDEINEHLKQTKFNEMFPPKGIEVVSWYVMMGIGQVVTLRVPANRLREVNLAIEKGAWGGYRTEFYATYDFKPVWEASRRTTPAPAAAPR